MPPCRRGADAGDGRVVTSVVTFELRATAKGLLPGAGYYLLPGPYHEIYQPQFK
jgi:hypothetical protein